MTLAQFDVVAEPAVKRKSKFRQILFFLVNDLVVPVLVILLVNAIGLGLCAGAFVLAHYFQFAKPFGQSEDAGRPRGFRVAIVMLILVHCITIVFNIYQGIRYWCYEKASSKGRRMIYIVGWILMAFVWFVLVIATVEDDFDDNLFGFRERVQ